MNNEIKIRAAKAEDAKALLNIYEPYVRNTAVTFEYEVPSLQTFAERICNVLDKYPYLLAEKTARFWVTLMRIPFMSGRLINGRRKLLYT